MSANAEARWARRLYKEGKISAAELDDAERDAKFEADWDEWEYEQEHDAEDEWLDY